MRQLIVNADDFGYTRGVNRAIREACRNGIVTSTSLLANGSAFEDAVEHARQERELDVGCHLNFVEGAPISTPDRIPHLVGSNGKFRGAFGLAIRLFSGQVPVAELEREAFAQVEKPIRAGLQPSHIDTHKHTHLHPLVASVVARTARHFEIPWVRRPFENYTPANAGGGGLRKIAILPLNRFASRFERRMVAAGLRLPDYFTGFLLTGRLTQRALEATLAALPEGVTEIMCHPGYCDAELEAMPTRLRQQRELELETVADGAWREVLADRGVILTGFREVAAPGRLRTKPVLAVPQPIPGD